MATEPTSPEAALSKTVSLSEEKLNDLIHDVYSADEQRGDWMEKIRVYYRRRVGLRPDRDYPWPGCANFGMPVIDKQIRRQKPVFVRSVFGVNPIFTVENMRGGARRGRKIEAMYSWLVKYRMRKAMNSTAHLADLMLTYGFAVMKVIWDYKTERVTQVIDVDQEIEELKRAQVLPANFSRASITKEDLDTILFRLFGLDPRDRDDLRAIADAKRQFRAGKKRINVSTQKITYDAPCWNAVEPQNVVVPWDTTSDPEDAPWICHIMKLRPQELRDRAKAGLYDQETVDAVLELKGQHENQSQLGQRSMVEFERQVKEGLVTAKGDANYVELWEVYFWHDINGDGLEERCVATISPQTSKALRVIEYPYFHNKWPFVRFAFEEKEDRWYSPRGVTEMLWDLNTIINVMHNSWIDARTLQNARTLKVKYNSPAARNTANALMTPGGVIKVRQQDDVEELGTQVLDFTYERLEGNARVWVDTYMGISDQSLIANQGRVERRTAREIEQIDAISDDILDLDLKLFQKSMQEVHWQTLLLWAQYGDDDASVAVDDDGAPVQFDKRMLLEHFDIVPSGSLHNSSGRARAQAAMQVLQVAGSIPQLMRETNIRELFKDYVEGVTDFHSGRRYVLPSGSFQASEVSRQLNEVQFMKLIGQVHEVDVSDDHAVHVQTIDAILGNAGATAQSGGTPEIGEQAALLLQGHRALHMAAAGDRSLIDQIEETTDFRMVVVGTKFSLQLMNQGAAQPQ
jgi:hypothetical protein